MLNHGVTFNLWSAKLCSPAIFETYFSHHEDIWIVVTHIYFVSIWEEFSRKGPPYQLAPQVCLPIASLLVDGISSNLAHIFSSPGKIF